MRTIAIIPARGGSKRLNNKNVLDLGGKPLLVWTLEAAQQSQIFDDIYVSTENIYIADLANHWGGGHVAWTRPAELAQDDTPTMAVVRNVTDQVFSDIVFVLQATSPFRTTQDILNVNEQLMWSKGDAVVSVTEAPNDLVFQLGHANRMRPRDDIVVPNGAIYAITTDALYRGEDWYSGISYAYRMPKDRSLDIDTEFDLEMARMMIAKRSAA